MPAQKRPHPSSAAPGRDGGHVEGGGGAPAPASSPADAGASNGGARSPKLANGAGAAAAEQQQEEKDRRRDDSDADDEEEEGEGGDRGGVGGGSGDGGDEDCDSQSSQSDGDVNEFIVVKLTDIRKEVQCPICLGIIRKTRTVMECLHRFCRDCIDKSMRLGNNECPACRTHCASRRSLRDDPNYDSLILALYPDIDKYEEEELAFSEKERTRNKKIQESIAETYRRQSEALVKKRSAAKATGSTYLRRTRGNMRARRRGRTSSPDIVPTDVDDEDKEENGNDGSKESSSVDDHSQDVRPKRSRRWPVSRHSPAKTVGSIDSSFEDSDDLGGGRDILTTSPLRGEMLAWGKNGTRSQTRHGNASSSSGRMAKGGRVAKLVDHLRNADAFDSKFNSYLVLLPLDEQSMPKLEKPYLSCQPTFSIGHLCQFVALELSRQPKEVQIYMRKNSTDGCSPINNSSADEAKPDQLNGLERLWEDKSLSELYPFLASNQGDLELLYSLKAQG